MCMRNFFYTYGNKLPIRRGLIHWMQCKQFVHPQYGNGSLLNTISNSLFTRRMTTINYLNTSIPPTKLWSCVCIKKSGAVTPKSTKCNFLQICNKITNASGTDLLLRHLVAEKSLARVSFRSPLVVSFSKSQFTKILLEKISTAETWWA